MKSFLLMQKISDSSPVIGVVTNVRRGPAGMLKFRERLVNACIAHFDEDVELKNIDGDLFDYWDNITATVIVGGDYEEEIFIYEVWIY